MLSITFIEHYNNYDKWLTIEEVCMKIYKLDDENCILQNYRDVINAQINKIKGQTKMGKKYD